MNAGLHGCYLMESGGREATCGVGSQRLLLVLLLPLGDGGTYIYGREMAVRGRGSGPAVAVA